MQRLGHSCGSCNLSPFCSAMLGPLHTWDWDPVTSSTLQAPSLVEKAEPVQVRCFTIRLRDQRSIFIYVNARWMESLHGFLHGIERVMFHGHLDYCQNPPLEGRLSTKPPWDHGIPNAHNCWFLLFYHVCRPACMNNFFIQMAFGWGSGHIWLHPALEDPWPH
jgi:hypothetical protein